MLIPPPRSPSTTPDMLRMESETGPWQWLQLCSWPWSEARTDWAQERGFPTTTDSPINQEWSWEEESEPVSYWSGYL